MSRNNILAFVSLVISIILCALFLSGVRLTTESAQRKAELQQIQINQLKTENTQLSQELQELKIRHNELIDYLEDMSSKLGENSGTSDPPNIFRIPGSTSYGNRNPKDTRTVERYNNSTTVSPPSNKDDSGGGSPVVKIPDIPTVPSIPKVPDLPTIPDLGKTKDNLLKDTPLGGLL